MSCDQRVQLRKRSTKGKNGLEKLRSGKKGNLFEISKGTVICLGLSVKEETFEETED